MLPTIIFFLALICSSAGCIGFFLWSATPAELDEPENHLGHLFMTSTISTFLAIIFWAVLFYLLHQSQQYGQHTEIWRLRYEY